MGSGRWDADLYDAIARDRAVKGASPFAYSDATTSSVPRSDWTVHPTLDPRGITTRECRDSADHQRALPILVAFDVTGSMGHIPRQLQQKLPQLHGLLLRKGYAQDPQICFGAFGDETAGDPASLQIGQFESDNRMAENLENILITSGGGGGVQESYQNMLYLATRHTASDHWEKRHAKGYLFLIGDEQAYPTVRRDEIAKLVDDGLQADLSMTDLMNELLERWNVFYILPKGAAHGGEEGILGFWRGFLGQNAVELDEPDAVCEVVGLMIGLCEGTTDLAGGIGDLRNLGTDDRTIAAVSSALADHPSALMTVSSSDGSLTDLATDTDGASGITRLT